MQMDYWTASPFKKGKFLNIVFLKHTFQCFSTSGVHSFGAAVVENDIEKAQDMCNAAQVVVRFAEKMLKAGFDVNDSKEEEFEQHGNYVADEQYQIDEKLNDYRRSGSITPNRAESSRSSMEPNPKRRLEEVHEPYYRPGKQLK